MIVLKLAYTMLTYNFTTKMLKTIVLMLILKRKNQDNFIFYYLMNYEYIFVHKIYEGYSFMDHDVIS